MWRKPASLSRLDRTILVQVILCLVWIVVLSWGERQSFADSVSSCRWDTWEQWPSQAEPHHLVFVADPQLVDPHTYPGRPWPLSSLTIRHTDQYMRRAFTAIQKHLVPQTVLFLGDLFDGGREWSTRSSKSPNKSWHVYDDKYWLGEYARFGKIFLDPWVASLKKQGTDPRRRLLASLPGNHDLGFAAGIQLPVRQRFQTYFGLSNRIDIIGNHSFVSVDTVSLSARSQQKLDDKFERIWQPAEDFVYNSRDLKAEAVERELRYMFGQTETHPLEHSVTNIEKSNAKEPHSLGTASGDMPTVLLTHVPLYRDSATPCGPLREHWPPSKAPSESEPPIEKDEKNSIKIHGGYQYQNVLDTEISNQLVARIGKVEYAFSGDDHDYCEVLHKRFSGSSGLREITVKSLSWAMGVRKPGFLLVSLWNPVDMNGTSLPQTFGGSQKSGDSTLQSHLCLLPDQLAVFIRYLFLLVITLAVVVIEAVLSSSSRVQRESYEPLLPLTNSNPPRTKTGRTRAGSTSISTNTNSEQSQLASRTTASRTRTGSPSNNYGYSTPTVSENEVDAIMEYQRSMELANGRHSSEKMAKAYHQSAPMSKRRAFLRRFSINLSRIASVGLLWYAWLAYTV